jgi:enamine deaminase RidA (YjgF/YER057c/UK114 family)
VAHHTRFINPEGLNRPPSYTQVVEVTGPGRTIYISGQLGTSPDGKLVGGDFRVQAEQVFKNLQAALAAVGAGFADIVKLNSYLKHIADLPILRDVRTRYLDPEALPASTTLEAPGFARPEALLEIEAVAVLPPRAVPSRRRAAQPSTSTRKLKTARRKAR